MEGSSWELWKLQVHVLQAHGSHCKLQEMLHTKIRIHTSLQTFLSVITQLPPVNFYLLIFNDRACNSDST